MSNPEEIKIPLRILINKVKNKVVFAESKNDFVDILFSFLTLPMGTIVRLLGQHSNSKPDQAIGSLNTLYEGLSNLHTQYLWTEECKTMLLNPKNSSENQCCKLKLNVDDTEPTKFFICQDWSCSRQSSPYLSTCNTTKCICGCWMNREFGLKDSNDKGGVFATETASFIITDDLHVMPNLPGSTLGLLNDFGIRDMWVLEEKIFNIGLKEILNLLKWSLCSKTPLTDLYLCKEHIISGKVKFEPCKSAQAEAGKETTTNSGKMTVKLMVQKSNNQPLFAQAGEDFVDFIFNFLTMPLGTAVCLLGGNTSLGSIDNLYKSISNLEVGRYMKSEYSKDLLLNPRLASQHLCKSQLFSVHEVQFYGYIDMQAKQYIGHLSLTEESKRQRYSNETCLRLKMKNSTVEGQFVRGPAMFMVTDDLVVTPLSTISSISFLTRLKIPLGDVEEQVVSIGMEEGLSILKASLLSTSALTNGLNLILKKPKQEK